MINRDMSTIRKTISFTSQQDAWIKSQVEKGDFTNDIEYLRDLVRRDRESKEEQRKLELLLKEGVSSGESSKTVDEIWNNIESKFKK